MPPDDPDFDCILDSPDSLPQSLLEAIITLGLPPVSPLNKAPSPVYSRSSSPSQMEVKEENPEDYSVGGLLSPERPKASNMEDEVFIFDEDMKYFESIKESFETRVGNPEVCQAIVNGQPKKKKSC